MGKHLIDKCQAIFCCAVISIFMAGHAGAGAKTIDDNSNRMKNNEQKNIDRYSKLAGSIVLAVRPFDMSVNSLPKGYEPTNFQNIFEYLELMAPKEKGKFETSDEFSTRQAIFDQSSLNGHASISDYYAFGIRRNVSYNPDSEEVTVELKALYSLDYSEKKGRPYVGQTAMGIKFTVTPKLIRENFFLTEGNARVSHREYKFKWEINEARNNLQEVRVLLVGRLCSPYSSVFQSHDVASLDYPFNVTSITKHINLEPKQLVFYDRRTGKVIHREVF